jgi:phosphatidylserine decarboxylase
MFIALQRLLPHHGLSRFAGWMANSRRLSQMLIRGFNAAYDVDLSEAVRSSRTEYKSFNDFFTRELKPDARPLDAPSGIAISPADGAISQIGDITDGQLLQAKGHRYSLEDLLGEADRLGGAVLPGERSLETGFEGGTFATIYLAPQDYHRVHLPVAGRLLKSRSIPGALYSVNGVTEAHIDGLFARNERLVCFFDSDFGTLAVILVGAMLVASIETVWGSPTSPYRQLETSLHKDQSFQRGAEIGRFLLGSTVIVCMQAGRASPIDGLGHGSIVRMGQPLFTLR